MADTPTRVPLRAPAARGPPQSRSTRHQVPGRPVAWCRPSGWLAWNGGTPERRRNLDMPVSTRMQLSNAAGDFPSSHQLPSVERHASPRDAPGGLDRNNWACGLRRARPGVPGSAWSTTRRTRRPRGVIERGAGAQRWRGGLLHRASHTPRDPPPPWTQIEDVVSWALTEVTEGGSGAPAARWDRGNRQLPPDRSLWSSVLCPQTIFLG